MRRLSEREVLEFIITSGMKKWIILSDLRQYFIEFVVMHGIEMPRGNGVKYVLREVIKLYDFFR